MVSYIFASIICVWFSHFIMMIQGELSEWLSPEDCYVRIEPDVDKGYINSSSVYVRDRVCRLIFPAKISSIREAEKINFVLKIQFDNFSPESLVEQSCLQTYIMFFTLNRKSRNKVAHVCNPPPNDDFLLFDADKKLEVVIIRAQFAISYTYLTSGTVGEENKCHGYCHQRTIIDDQIIRSKLNENKQYIEIPTLKDKLDSEDYPTNKFDKLGVGNHLLHIKPQILDKVTCETDQQRFVCKSTRFCNENLFINGNIEHTEDDSKKILCNQTAYLCINGFRRCDGYFDCFEPDVSDELGCVYPLISAILWILFTLVYIFISVFCYLKHKACLRKNDMVRFNGDVFRRQDIVEVKKQNNLKTMESFQPEHNRISSLSKKSKKGILKNTNLLFPKNSIEDIEQKTPQNITITKLIEKTSTEVVSTGLEAGKEFNPVIRLISDSSSKVNDMENSNKKEDAIPLRCICQAKSNVLDYGYRFEYRNQYF